MSASSGFHRLFANRQNSLSRWMKLARSHAFLWLSLAVAGTAFADNAKISPDLQALLANPSSTVHVIVQYKSSLPSCSGGFLGAVLCGPTASLLGGTITQVLTLINAVAGSMPASNVVTLSNQSNVSYISLDRPVAPTLDYSTNGVNAPVAWNSGWDGSGVGVAVIDSGIDAHPDLNNGSGRSRVVYRQSFVGGVQNDDYGHGTHVAGIIAGNGATSNVPGSSHVLRGIAPKAKLLDLRVLDQNGSSSDSAVIAAIQTAVNLRSLYNGRV
ncbi:MAG TPA: S8 family serine peptidase, partial [Bryobacteraceae bacterium]|nr:S8 family serine peptidase [Bryobacteraceae bacterium]